MYFFFYGLNKPGGKDLPCEEQYRVLMGTGGRVAVFMLGLLSFVGSFVLMIVASKMCGKLTSFIEAMCQVLQALLSLFLALWERSKKPQTGSQRPSMNGNGRYGGGYGP